MKSISAFFKRIVGAQAKEMARREVIRLAIKQNTNIEVLLPEISIKSNTVNLKGLSQSARSVIYIHKKKIIDQIKAIDSTLFVSDIR